MGIWYGAGWMVSIQKRPSSSAVIEPRRPEDLARVHALQDEVTLVARPGAPAPPEPPAGLRDVDLDAFARDAEVREPGADDGHVGVGTRQHRAFACSVARVVRDLAPASVPAEVQDDLATCGLTEGDPSEGLVDALRDGLADGVRAIEARVGALGRVAHGWALNEVGPDVGADLALRAAVAMAQIYVNPVQEAVYPVAEVDDRGELLDGAERTYAITFAADDQPPAAAFWSLTVYHRAGLLVENPLGRYAVGDRTPGLRREADGSLRVEVAAYPPADGTANWLPAPPGPFRLMLRLYHPRDPGWVPPPVVRTD